MTDIAVGTRPADSLFADETAEMDGYVRQFLATAARYVFSGASASSAEAPGDHRNSEK